MKCQHPDCSVRIPNRTITGLCREHLNAQRALAVRYCPCGTRIKSPNKTGLCRYCYIKTNAAKVRKCADCGIEISKKTVSGRCPTCWITHKHGPVPTCTHEGCGVNLKRGNVTGKCFRHVRNLREAKPTEMTMAVVREVGQSLGVTPRDILSGLRFSEIVEGRAVVVVRLRERGLSFSQIGNRLGRDHSSLVSLVRKVPIYAARNPKVAAILGKAA